MRQPLRARRGRASSYSPGLVLRCPDCGEALLRLVRAPGRSRLNVRELSSCVSPCGVARGWSTSIPARLAGPHLLVSGIVGIDPSTGSLAGDTIQDQTRQALTNCQAILQAGGARLDDVIEVGILLTRPADFAGLNEEYARWFPSEPPARYVAKLGVELPGLLVSIRMSAFIG
jgi:enamine deaminase RidA (YjgF/YER057c/UK114 family)